MMRAPSGLMVMLVGASLSLLACGGATPRDINFGKDAGADFTPPDLPPPIDTSAAAGVGGTAGVIGTAGATGAAGDPGAAGAGGAAGGGDASDAAVSDGADGPGDAGQ
jgi:hypothetical protein